MQGVYRPQRPALQKLDGTRYDKVRDVDQARVFDVFEERLLGFAVWLQRQLRRFGLAQPGRNGPGNRFTVAKDADSFALFDQVP